MFAATGGMGPTATTVFRKLALCWLRNVPSITVDVSFGCDVDFFSLVEICSDVFEGSSFF